MHKFLAKAQTSLCMDFPHFDTFQCIFLQKSSWQLWYVFQVRVHFLLVHRIYVELCTLLPTKFHCSFDLGSINEEAHPDNFSLTLTVSHRITSTVNFYKHN